MSSCFHYRIFITLKRHIFTFSFVLLLQGVILQAWGQDYQRAKDVLRGVTAQETTLYQFPSPTAKRVIKLPKNTPVLIYGKQGGFLDVRYLKIKGWGDSRAIIISGPTQSSSPEPIKPVEPAPAAPMNRPVSTSGGGVDLPIRLNPYITYSTKGKSFEKQIRGGIEATYAVTPNVGVGLVGDAVFLRGTYVDIGPIVRHQWGNGSSMFFNPAIYAGFLYYTFDYSGVSDQGFGIQTAIENDIPIMRDNEFQPAISMKFGTDLMFFYFDEVRIPVFFSVGAAFKF
jgi:hypothetical protein